MRCRSSSNCADFVYTNELKRGPPKLVNGNKVAFQTFTRLATYSKAEQIEMRRTLRHTSIRGN